MQKTRKNCQINKTISIPYNSKEKVYFGVNSISSNSNSFSKNNQKNRSDLIGTNDKFIIGNGKRSNRQFVKVKRANIIHDDINGSTSTIIEEVNKVNSDQYIKNIRTLNTIAFERSKTYIDSKKILKEELKLVSPWKESSNQSTDCGMVGENSFQSFKNSSNIRILNDDCDELNHNKTYSMKEGLSFENVKARINNFPCLNTTRLNKKRNRGLSNEKGDFNKKSFDEDEVIENQKKNFQNCFFDSFNGNKGENFDGEESDSFERNIKVDFKEKKSEYLNFGIESENYLVDSDWKFLTNE